MRAGAQGTSRRDRRAPLRVCWAGLAGLALAVAASAPLAGATDPAGVAATPHNLSVTGPGEVRSLTEPEICKFCHIPHNPVASKPLWGHALSRVGRYEVPRMRTGRSARGPAPQPDGASRLCLSCHDGTVALGEIAGERETIPMAGAERLGPGRPGYLGTDLSGSHPVSFVVPDGDQGAEETGFDMGLRPLSSIQLDPDVHLDPQGKMQCTTCHDPHSDRYYRPGEVPRFWVKPTFEEVCLTCHELR